MIGDYTIAVRDILAGEEMLNDYEELGNLDFQSMSGEAVAVM